jgi:O-methyltransferase involved in polyketide biosynthesis
MIDLKNDLKLGVVQETLLLPLLARAEEASWKAPLLNDKKAVEITERLHFDKSIAKKQMSNIGILGLAVRAYKMDNIIKNFMTKYPKGKVLNIGAGLDTAFYRCDNGKVLWYDLDLPDSMALRIKLLGNENERVTSIPKSMLDYSWMNDLGDISNGLLIFIPGVLPYFSSKDVSIFLKTIAQKLKGAEVIFDSINDVGRYFVGQRIKNAGMTDAKLLWGVWHPFQITSWSKHIKLVSFEPFFKNIERKKSYGLILNNFMNYNDFFRTTNLVHLKFI